MSKRIDDGGPAFPFPSGPEPRVDQFHERCDGMSLRDWFAGMALQGLLANGEPDFGTQGKPLNPWQWWVMESYRAADAMIEERNKTK